MIALHLKSLTLKGFKSFAQPTSLEFEPGITCIVGPNGSGKSNVVDALAWVMGEQGPKTLRGGKMEDVIFAGTQQLGPLGRAEVKLTIDNSDGQLPIDYSEVTIGRILFRNGSSEYSINGEVCRLLDVQELLSDSGLGREMHVIVGQGQLDAVLRSDPLEIRGFIEEAAGILKYRARKEKSQRKLESMQGNFDRLTDLITEIKRQLRPLAKQAEIAQGARDLQRELRQSKIRLFGGQLTELTVKLQLAVSAETEASTEATYLEQELQTSRTAISQLERQLVSAAGVDLSKQLGSLLENRSRIAQLQIDVSSNPALELESKRSATISQLEELKANRSVIENELAGLEGELSNLNLQLVEIETEKGKIADVIRLDSLRRQELELEREQRQRSLAERLSALNVLQSQLEAVTNDISLCEERITNSEIDLANAIAEQEQLDIRLDSRSGSAIRQELEGAEQALTRAVAALEAARVANHSAEREQDALSAELSALNTALAQGVQIKEVRELNIAGVSGWLAESMTIREGKERAVSAALGSLGEAILVDSFEAALAAAKKLNRSSARHQFVVADAAERQVELPSGIDSLADFVSAPSSILRILANFAVVSDLAAAQELLSYNPQLQVVTESGEFVSSFLISAGGEEQRSQLELVARRDACSAELELSRARLNSTSAELLRIQGDARACEEILKGLAARLREHDAEFAQLAEQTGRSRARVEALESQVSRERERLLQLSQSQAAIRESLSAMELAETDSASQSGVEGSDVLADDLAGEESAEETRAEIEAKLENLRARELGLRISIGSTQERLQNRQLTLGEISRKQGLAQNQVATLSESINTAGAKQVTYLAVAAKLDVIRGLADDLLLTQQTKLEEAKGSNESLRLRLEESRSKQVVLEQKLSVAKEKLQNIEIEQHELRLHLSNLEDKARIELGLEPNELIQPKANEEQITSRAELEKQVRSIESRLNSIGQFNPLALEEHRALTERHEYLLQQLDDLNRTRSELLKIISELDADMVEIFQAAFSDAAREFEKVFPNLFPGGSGSLSLTEPENPLLSGVSVNVKPAGKRIERMSLLSGGERSLAAVALLIAIFKARPSPFYVLDEVEAALDDANLGRLLAELSVLGEAAQLIVVTHQKRTMEIAQLLYGISMAKSGVSTVVSSRLEMAS